MAKSQYQLDLAKKETINYNNADIPKPVYNLVISIRDLKLWKIGMKPHRHWKVTNVKKYFGLTGRCKQGLVDQAEKLLEEYKG